MAQNTAAVQTRARAYQSHRSDSNAARVNVLEDFALALMLDGIMGVPHGVVARHAKRVFRGGEHLPRARLHCHRLLDTQERENRIRTVDRHGAQGQVRRSNKTHLVINY